MSGLIYKEQQTSNLQPSAPDFKAEGAVAQKQQDIKTLVEKQEEFQLKEAQADLEYEQNLTKATAGQIMKNVYTLYPNDPVKYKTEVEKQLKPIYAQLPDSKEKFRIMAEVQIAGTGYEANIQKNAVDLKSKQRNNSYRNNVLNMVDSAQKGLTTFFNVTNNNLSPEEKVKQEKAFVDAQYQLKKAYDSRYAVDDNKNPIFDRSEIKVIEDAYENRGKYMVLGYASENIYDNRQGVVDNYNYMRENKAEIIKKYDMDTEEYNKTLDEMEKIIDGESSVDKVKTEVMITSLVDSFNIKDGEAEKKVKKEDLFNAIVKLDEAYEDRLVDGAYYKSNSAKLKGAYYNKEEKMFKKQGVWQDTTAGVNALKYVDTMTQPKGDSITSKALKFDLTRIVLDAYSKAGVDPKSTNPVTIQKSNEILLALRPKLMKLVYPDADSEELKTDKGQKNVIIKEVEKASKGKAKAILGNELDNLDWSNTTNQNIGVR
jgi:hypothetical protein